MSVPCYFCICTNTWMWFFPCYLDLSSYFPPFRLSLQSKTNGWLWCEKSMTADLTVLENQDHYTLQETGHHLRVTLCEGIVFSVATASKSSQICFGRDPVVLVSLIAFPTTLHDYQIMCSRTQTNTLQFVSLLIAIYRLNLQLFLANILPLLPFPFTASSMLSQLDGNLHFLIVYYLTNILLGSWKSRFCILPSGLHF